MSQLSLDILILAHGRDSHQQLYHGVIQEFLLCYPYQCSVSGLVEIIANSQLLLACYSIDLFVSLLSFQWQKWLRTWEDGDDMGDGNAELFIRTLNLSSRSLDESLFSHPKYKQLLEITSRVCGQLRLFQNRKVRNNSSKYSSFYHFLPFDILE